MKTTRAKIISTCIAGVLLLAWTARADTTNFTTAGTFTWTVPNGVHSVLIEAWGGGGAGGGGRKVTTGAGGGGGGGGAYAASNITVTAGTTYTVVVGGGGTHMLVTSPDYTNSQISASGTNSWFGTSSTTNCLAMPGAGGQTIYGSTGGTGGAGGASASNIGVTNWSGGAGRTATASRGGGGGGGAGNAGAGGTSTGNNNNAGAAGAGGGGAGGAGAVGGDGSPGGTPGGGGGGGEQSGGSTRQIGGDGAAGKVLLTYTVAYDHVNVESAANGTGSAVSAQTLSSGNSTNVYAIGRESDNTFIANVAATWSLINKTGGVADGDLVPSGDNKSAVFTAHLSGSAQIQAVFGTITTNPSGTITVPATGTVGAWTNDADSTWTTAANWDSNPTVPSAAGDTAILGVGSALRTVTLDASETVGTLSFTNSNSFVVSGANTLTLDKSGSGALIQVADGSANAIQTPVSLNDNANALVASGKSLSISGNISSTSTSKKLTVGGPGKLALSGNNTYGPASSGTVGTTVSGGGTLQVGSNTALGSGDVTNTLSSTLQAGAAGLSVGNNFGVASGATMTVDNNGNALTLGGIISGGGTLAKIGNGTLTLGGANTYSGGTTVNGGAVSISADGNLGAAPGSATANNVVLNGGVFLDSSSLTLNGNRGIGIGPTGGSTPGIGMIDAASGQTLTINGVIASAGNTGANNLVVNVGAGNNGTVVLNATNTFSGNTVISNGTLTLGNSFALTNSTLDYNNYGGSLSFGTLTNATLGGLSGAQNLSLLNGSSAAVALSVGGNNSSTTYSGGLSGTGSTLTKNGNGTQILTGNNTFSGAAVVNGGTLQLNSGGIINHSAADGTGTVNGNGQMLVSGGSLTAASFNVATPSIGLAVSSGSATFSGALTMNSGGSQASQNGLITVTGSGSLSAASLAMGRMGSTITAQPTNGVNTYGFYVNGGTANISGDVSVCTQSAANSGNSMRIDSGSFTVGGLVTLAGGATGGRWSVMDVNGGTFEVDNTASGFNIGGNNGGNANLFVRAGVAKIGKITLGNAGQTGNSVALIMTGGSLYVGSGGIVSAANVPPANSPITMTNATLGAWADWSSTNAITLNGTNTIKAADDTGTAHNITLSGPVGGNFNSAITKIGNGTLTLSGANFFTNGATVSAGKLNINGINALGGAFYGGLTLADGTLQYSTNSTGNGSTDISLTPNASVGITLAAGTDTIDVNGNSVTYASPIGNGGSGSLVIQSTGAGGVLNLTSDNSYSGNTTVSSGTLRVNNTAGSATGSGNVTVNSGGTLGGDGIISGTVEIASSGILAPGNSIGNLTVGSLQLDSGAIGSFEFNLTTNDLVVSTGGLTVNGGAFNLYADGSTAPWTTVGTYKLVSYTGADPSLDSTWTTTSGSNPHVLHPYPICLYSFAASGGYLTLTITLNPSSVAGTWTNNANGNWSSAANWDSNPSIPHSIGDTATLGNSTAQRTVTLNANETVGSVTFNNANSFVIANAGNTLTLNNSGFGANIYVLDGTANAIQTAVALNDNTVIAANSGKSVSISGNISGSSVTVNGAGTVALSGNNSYAGTTLGGGTLQVGSNSALGANALSVTANGTLQAGTAGLSLGNAVQVASSVAVTVDSAGNNLSLDGNISGNGGLTKTGNGTLALNGLNTFSGNATVAGGVLAMSSSLNMLQPAEIVLNGGVLLGDTGIDGDGEYAIIGIGPVSGGTGGTGMLDAASAQTFLINGAIGSAGNSGVNNLTVNSLPGDNGTVMLLANNSFNGTTVISNGVLLLETSGGLQNSTLNYNNQGGALHFDTGVGSATLGGLTGGQDLTLVNQSGGVVALTVGGNGSSTIYSGGLQDNGMAAPLTKAGNGTLALAGANNCGGTTTVSAGQLQVTTNGVLDTAVASISSVAGVQLVVNGGTLVATNASFVGNPSGGLHVSAGSANYLTSLTVNSAANGAMIGVTGGSLTAGSLTLGRTGLSDTTQPGAGSTTDGLYVNGGAVNIITNLNMGTPNAANSSANVRLDSGSLTVGGTLTVAVNNGGRWSVVDVNGGTLTVTNTTTGINLGGPLAGNTLLLVRSGVVNAGIIGLGNTLQTNGDTAALNVTNGSLYVGAGGIVQVSSNVTPQITLFGGLVGASADWACSNNIVLGNPTIQAADSLNVAHNIALSGILSGTNLTKTGSGTLTLSAANTYAGVTTISNGTLTLSASGSIPSTARVAIGAGATFDVAALGGYTFTGVSPVQTLAGASTSGAGNVAAGGNTVTLNSGASTLFQADGTGSTVGKVSVAGNVTLNNNTVTINVTSAPLGGGTNRLLDCTGTLSGSANITPVITGLGLASGSATVVTTPGSNGHVDLVVNSSLIPTQSAGITGFNLVGNNVVLNATNGQSGGTYYLLTSTNIANPIGVWAPVATNVITTNGVGGTGTFTFTGTNVVNPNDAQQYYILSNTNNH